jgi:outer membrane lipoprotein-sorting protein
MMEGSHELAYTATVSKVANLGIPDIGMGAGFMPDGASPDGATPDGADASMADTMPGALLTTALEVFSGEHTARVALDPQVGVRVQVQDQMAERNIVVNDTEAWLYDSSSNTATRITIPDEQALAAAFPDAEVRSDEAAQKLEQRFEEFASDASADFSTPAGVAQFVIDELDAESTISMADNVRVADRAAYEMRVTPDASDTLVESIALAIDAETGLPLRVEVNAVGQDAPAFSFAITALDLSTPDPALFTFTPPPGATVTDAPEFEMPADRPAPSSDASVEAPDMPTVVQTGWATIVEIPAGSMPDELAANPLLEQFATSVDGGLVVRTALATVFIADDGRVFVGTVPLSALQSAAAR